MEIARGRSTMHKKNRYEFGGPAGNILMMIGLPAVVYYLYFCARFNGGRIIPGAEINYAPFEGFLDSITPTLRAALLYVSWFLFQATLHVILPGRRVSGVRLNDGTSLKYKLNGLLSFIVTIVVIGLLSIAGIAGPDTIYNNFGALISVTVIFAYALSFFLFAYGKTAKPADPLSGSTIHDFFMGVSLNPRVPPVTGFDIKFFCESRPGLIGWLAVSVSFMGVQYMKNGSVTAAMVLVVAFQFLYIADFFWNEPAILTTTDIVHDRFGFMLVFGDLAWVPLTYSLQAFYLIEHVHSLPAWGIISITLLNAAGYYLFRTVNLQKHKFRTVPGYRIWGKKPDFIQTEQGNKLLVSGFWGWSRHFNYIGDIMMALAWCLPCLFASPLPYFYAVYFTVLLVHRQRRDDRKCAIKYGEDWEKYRERVPWRILPGIY
jgi:Delta14-sterol reductase